MRRRRDSRRSPDRVLFADRGLQHPQTAQEGARTQAAREHIALKSDSMYLRTETKPGRIYTIIEH